MRIMSFLPFVLLVSCAGAPPDPVTKSYPEAAPAGLSIPAMQSFSLQAPSSVRHSNSELAANFLALEFHLEGGRDLNRITRFEGPISVALTGNVPTTASAELTRLIARFRAEAGLNIATAPSAETASITVNFVSGAWMKRLVPSAACFVVPGVSSLAEYRAAKSAAATDWAQIMQRSRVAVFIPENASPQEVRDCLHEELAQAMGPLNDLFELPDSVFNDDNFNTVLTDFDMLMLRLHYAPDLQSGMGQVQVASLLPELLARYNPSGQFVSGNAFPSRSPTAWLALVPRAMGSDEAGGRKSAAQKMLQMALAQGWQDNRLGLSYFLLGRLTAPSDPAQAIAYFNAASNIYRSMPDGGIHAAHVSLQLAGIALSSGQNAQAVAFADSAIPALKAGQNAAMLSTLMLIKAKALEEMGRIDAAQAIRLDTVGWARYGFGSDQAMRAKTAEIAALAARG